MIDQKSKISLCVSGLSLLIILEGCPAAYAEGARETCTLKATETLSKIAGTVITSTRAKTLEAPEGWRGLGPPILIEVDFNAPGTVGTSRYWCTVGSDGEAILERLTP